VALAQKKLPLIIDAFGGWLDTPDYYFYWTYLKDKLFNASSWDSPELAGLVDKTLDMEQSSPEYAPLIKRMFEIAFDEVPRIPLWQPALDSAMVPALQGYQTWFHRVPDARPLVIA
jgi:peptide/nickel transport system substrate-binding protein